MTESDTDSCGRCDQTQQEYGDPDGSTMTNGGTDESDGVSLFDRLIHWAGLDIDVLWSGLAHTVEQVNSHSVLVTVYDARLVERGVTGERKISLLSKKASTRTTGSAESIKDVIEVTRGIGPFETDTVSCSVSYLRSKYDVDE